MCLMQEPCNNWNKANGYCMLNYTRDWKGILWLVLPISSPSDSLHCQRCWQSVLVSGSRSKFRVQAFRGPQYKL